MKSKISDNKIRKYLKEEIYKSHEDVIILPNIDKIDDSIGSGTNTFMSERGGMITTIERVESPYLTFTRNVVYRLQCDCKRWAWNNHMLLSYSPSLQSWCFKIRAKPHDDFREIPF